MPATPTQQRVQGHVEAVIRLAAPALSLVLFAADRVSRVAGRGDRDTDLIPPPPRGAIRRGV